MNTLLLALMLAQLPTIKVDVQMVRAVATVKDSSGNLVGALQKEQFQIWDSGVRQEIAAFERSTELPLSVAILIDASGSTAKDLPLEIESVKRFTRALFAEGNTKDTASLYAFNYETRQLVGFTRRQSRIDNALKKLKGEAGTSVYDAIHFASKDLDDRKGRKVIIVVTDGGDTTSAYQFRHALQSAQRADTVIYPIVIQPIRNNAGRNIGGENALTSLAFQTGGRTLAATLGKDLDRAFTEILSDLRTQYLFAWYPRNLPKSNTPFHQIRIEIIDPALHNLQVFTRSGYYESSLVRHE